MRALALLLVTFCTVPLAPANAHDRVQEAVGIDGKADRGAEQRPRPENSLTDEELHPEIAALIERTGACFEFRVRASRGTGRSETKHIQRCD